MCLAVPGKIIKIENTIATVDYGSEQRTAKLITDEFKEGEYAVVQGGIVAIKIDEEEAKKALALYQEAVQTR